MRWQTGTMAIALLAALAGPARAQDANAPPAGKYVTREEYQKLQDQMQAVMKELDSLRKQRAAPPANPELQRQVEILKTDLEAVKKENAADRGSPEFLVQLETLKKELDVVKSQRTTQATDYQQALDDFESELKDLKRQVGSVQPGDTKMLLTGFGFAGYTSPEHGNSTFSAGFNPIFLWQMSDRLLFEGELEFTLNRDEFGANQTDVSLEYANISYLLNDYVTLGGGKFLMPFGVFNERLHMAWINKLPDRPLPFADDIGIAPEAGIGAYVRGGAPIGPTKINYAVYGSNGPELNTTDPAAAGTMGFDNFLDSNHNKAVGGRVGFLPIPEVEVGYSMQYAEVNPTGFDPDVRAVLQAMDASYVKELDWLRGTIDARVEWVWSNVSRATYSSPGPPAFGPVTFNNNRNGGYAQLAYRPTKSTNKVLKNLEFVGRFDILSEPEDAPGSINEHRWTLGVDYWVTPSFVLKAAYQIDKRTDAPDNNVLLLQTGLGF